MDTTYRKNLKAVLTASKDYTDNSIEKLKWELGTYDLSVETINGTTMLLPTPANTIQAHMVRIDGNSEVSENLKDLSYPTLDYKRNNMNSFIMSTSDTSTTRIRCETIPFKATNRSEFYVNNIPSNATLLGVGAFDSEQQSISNAISVSGNKFTINANGVEYIYFLFSGTDFNDNTKALFNQIGIFKTNIYEPYFEGIHNLELSGLKVEGANLSPISSGQTNFLIDALLPKGTYTLSCHYKRNLGQNSGFNIRKNTTTGSNIKTVYTTEEQDVTTTFTLDEDCKIFINCFSNSNVTNIMLNYGSTALPYTDYVAPTTKTIDLSTILYNGSPLFEGNSLKGVGTAKDYITPYKAHKEVGSRAYQTGDEEDTSVLTDGTTTLYPLTTPIEADIDFSQFVKFEAYSNGSITLVNTNNQDTTSTFKYLKEVAK